MSEPLTPETVEAASEHVTLVDRARRLLVIRDLLGIGVVIAALTVLVFVFIDKQNDQDQFLAQSETNAVAIDKLVSETGGLRSELASARQQIEAGRTADQRADECIDFASAALDVAVADLVIALTNRGDDRDAAIADAIEGVREAKDFLRDVLNERTVDCPPPIVVDEIPTEGE